MGKMEEKEGNEDESIWKAPKGNLKSQPKTNYFCKHVFGGKKKSRSHKIETNTVQKIKLKVFSLKKRIILLPCV